MHSCGLLLAVFLHSCGLHRGCPGVITGIRPYARYQLRLRRHEFLADRWRSTCVLLLARTLSVWLERVPSPYNQHRIVLRRMQNSCIQAHMVVTYRIGCYSR